jgi:acyl carrier protein
MNDVETRLRTFLSSHFLIDFGEGVDRTTNLFAAGFIDSYGLAELVAFLEREFGIEIAQDDLMGAALMSVGAIVETVANRQAAVR